MLPEKPASIMINNKDLNVSDGSIYYVGDVN